ncbi:MAG: hypothetical protein ACXAAO_15020 [Candidatus Thorarchaeota archaeon]|jgi:hypothetical protein
MSVISLGKRPTESTIKELFTRSGNCCAIGKHELYMTDAITGKPILDDRGKAICIGQAAHIETPEPTRPRYNPALSEEASNKVENLVALCKNCHDMVDSDTVTYTPEKLREIKRRHEDWARTAVRSAVLDLGYDDLRIIGEIVGVYTSTQQPLTYDTIPHEEKIRKNGLSSEVRAQLTDGFLHAQIVRQYLNEAPFLGIASRLQSIFVSLYLEAKNNGLIGDALFHELWGLSSGFSVEGRIRAGALVMISYYFELCEVFEK